MKRLLFLVLLIFYIGNLYGQKNFFVNLTPGTAVLLPSPLKITQSGYDDLKIWARYKSSPFRSPVYYSIRVGWINGDSGYELEMNHLKIHLQNTTNEISRFSISHGYNQIFINQVKSRNKIGRKIGVGLVLVHPENTVRGVGLNQKQGMFNEGYYIAGLAAQYGVFKELNLTKYFYILAELRTSIAYANVPVANGRAHVPILAFHLQLGPGFRIPFK